MDSDYLEVLDIGLIFHYSLKTYKQNNQSIYLETNHLLRLVDASRDGTHHSISG